MATDQMTPEQQLEVDRKAARAQAERDRRAKKKAEQEAKQEAGNGQARSGRVPKDPEAAAVAKRAKEIAPQIKSPYQPFEARSLMTIVGTADPIKFIGLSDEALAGRNVRDAINAWACGELESKDPVAVELRAKAREVAKDERARNLWGKKVGALILAIDEAR